MFTDAEQAFLREALDHPEDVSRRLVLADQLLERGEPLGELLRLECTPGPLDVARVAALRAELEPVVRQQLYPFAVSVGFDGGLPFAVEVDAARLRAPGPWDQPCEVPARWVRISGEPGFVFNLLRQPVCARVECVDLFRASFNTPYTQFVGEPPPPVPRLRSLRHVWLPDAPPPAHWLPFLQETFLDVEVVSVRSEHFSLDAWLALMPAARCIDLRGAGPRIHWGLRQDALRFVKAGATRELRLNGVRILPEHLEEAVVEPPRPQAALPDTATPAVEAVSAVEVRRFLDASEHLADATVGGEAGLWLRQRPSGGFLDAAQVEPSARLAMLAPRHPHLVTPRRAALQGQALWLRLPEGLTVFEPASDAPGAVRDAVQLGRALEALAPWLLQHASPMVNLLPVPRWGLLRGADGALQLLAPTDRPFVPEDDAQSWGLPVDLAPHELARGLAAVLVHWLTGRPWALLTTPGGAFVYADWVAAERAKRARLPEGLPAELVPLLSRALGDRYEERVPLTEFLAGLEGFLRR